MSALPAQHRFALRSRAFSAVDVSAGVIRGVSVITIGPAKGHGIEVDATTLEQVKACAESYQGGLKVKMEHAGDAGDIVGFLTNFHIEGAQLLADLHLLKSTPHREYIMELAQTIPDTFGLSIAFSGPVEVKNDTRLARCAEIYSCDMVGEPAANPSGLFDAGPLVKADNPSSLPIQPTIKMDEKKIQDMIDCAIKGAIDSLSARLSKLETPPAPAANPDEQKAMQAKQLSEVAELAAKSALTAFMATLGTPPAAPSGEAQKPVQKKFEELVREHAEYSKNKAAAIKAVVRSNPTEYADYNKRLSAGEVVMF